MLETSEELVKLEMAEAYPPRVLRQGNFIEESPFYRCNSVAFFPSYSARSHVPPDHMLKVQRPLASKHIFNRLPRVF